MPAGDGLELETFKDIYTAIARVVKGDLEDLKTLEKIKELINTTYEQIASNKKWKWRRLINRSLFIRKPYTTGTISILNLDRAVTGVGTNWTADYVGWFIKPAGSDQSYRIVGFDNPTSLTISSQYTAPTLTNSTYTLYQSEVALFPDLDDIDDLRLDDGSPVVRPHGPSVINALRQRFPGMTGRPKIYSIEGTQNFCGPLLKDFVLGYDFLGAGQTKAMSYFPHIPDRDYTIHAPYIVEVPRLERDTDTPLIPREYRYILKFGVLAEWYSGDRQDNTGGYYRALFNAHLKEFQNKYMDTDDVFRLRPYPTQLYPESYLKKHSSSYFDQGW